MIKTFSALILLVFSFHSVASEQDWNASYLFESQGLYEQAIEVIQLPQFISLNIDMQKLLSDHKTRALKWEPGIGEKIATYEFTLMRIAWLHYQNKDYSQSIDMYKKASQLNPESIDALIGLLSPLAALHRWKEVTIVAEQVLASIPLSYQAHLFLMQAREQERKWTALEDEARILAVKFPTSVDPWVYLARALQHQHKAEEAVHAYQQVLVRFPNNMEALRYLQSQP